jgi:DNA-binding MarR family transcriptional regulator
MSQYGKELNTMLNKTLMRVNRINSNRKLGSAVCKLDMMDVMVLDHLNIQPQSLKSLCNKMNYPRVDLAKIASRLLKVKLIKKSEDPTDKRLVVLGLTEFGEKQLEVASTKLHVPLDFAISELTINEEKAVLKYLSRLHQGLKQLEDHSEK